MNMTPRVINLESASEGAGSSEGRGAAVEKSRAGMQSDFSSGSEVHRDVHRTEANVPAVPKPLPSSRR